MKGSVLLDLYIVWNYCASSRTKLYPALVEWDLERQLLRLLALNVQRLILVFLFELWEGLALIRDILSFALGFGC